MMMIQITVITLNIFLHAFPATIASLLDADSLKLYTLIWARAMACQMEPASVVKVIYELICTSNPACSMLARFLSTS